MSGAAEVHPNATLTPSKIELLQGWLPDQEWFEGDAADLKQAARFRFVDPDGEVGLDSIIATSEGRAFYVPLTWRAAPIEDAYLVGTLEHSELGTRYGYDATTDPVFLAEVTRVIVDADSQSEILDPEGNTMPLTARATGTGVVLESDGERLIFVRRLDRDADMPGDALGALVVDWVDDGGPRRDAVALLL